MTDAVLGGIIAYCDGGSRGNPGPSGYGVSIEDEAGHPIAEVSEFLGVKTNNFAEYSGLLAALEYALRQGHPRLRVVADSELMVKQMKGLYRVNSPDLRPLWEEAKRRAAQLDRFEIQHVLRGKNKRADALANQAMDRGTGKTVKQVGGGGSQPMSSATGSAMGSATPAATHSATRPHLVTSAARPSRPGETKATEARPAEARLTAARPTETRLTEARPTETRPTETRPTETRPAEASPAERSRTAPPAEKRTLKGFVRNGVVHLLEGELPENCFVRVTPE